MSRPDLLTRLRRIRRRTRSKLLDMIIDEILQLKAAAAVAQQGADRWQARAERAEREQATSQGAGAFDNPLHGQDARGPGGTYIA